MRNFPFLMLPFLFLFSFQLPLSAKTDSVPQKGAAEGKRSSKDAKNMGKDRSSPNLKSQPGKTGVEVSANQNEGKEEAVPTPGEIIKKVVSSFSPAELDSLRSVFPNLMNLPGEPPTVLGPPPPIVVDQNMFKVLDPIVEKLIAAYHAKNVKTFYDLFATSVSSISDPKIFRKNYLTPGFGKCLKRKIAPEKCSFFAPAPLVQYDAEFEKAGKVTVSVNFIREGKEYKVLRVNFEKTP